MIFIKKGLFVVIFVLLFLSCKSNEKNNGISYNKNADGWLNSPNDNEFQKLEPINIPIEYIENDKLNEARKLLEECFYKILTDKEFEYFTGKAKTGKTNAYIIRSVNYSFNEKGYRIYLSDKNNLLIFHRVLGSGKEKGIQKWPIIIMYDDLDTINIIYTNYSVVK
jgi:hypothetical protein